MTGISQRNGIGDYAVCAVVQVGDEYRPVFATEVHDNRHGLPMPDMPGWTCIGGTVQGSPAIPGSGATITLVRGHSAQEAVELAVQILAGE